MRISIDIDTSSSGPITTCVDWHRSQKSNRRPVAVVMNMPVMVRATMGSNAAMDTRVDSAICFTLWGRFNSILSFPSCKLLLCVRLTSYCCYLSRATQNLALNGEAVCGNTRSALFGCHVLAERKNAALSLFATRMPLRLIETLLLPVLRTRV